MSTATLFTAERYLCSRTLIPPQDYVEASIDPADPKDGQNVF